MTGHSGLGDLRFQGYSNEQLARQVDGLRNGPGSESLHNAIKALVGLAAGLAETDRVLRGQLREIGVHWQGQAGEGGTRATQDAAVFAEEAVTPVTESARGVASQSGSFSHTRDSAPDSAALRGPTELTGWDRFTGAFGHTTDHAREVRDTAAARDQAVAGMTGYQRSSSDALGRAQALPVPPGIDLVTRPAGAPTQVSGPGTAGPGGGLAPGAAVGVGGPGAGGIGDGPGPRGGPGTAAPFTGGPGVPPGVPGSSTGVGPVPPLTQGAPGGQAPVGLPRGVPSLLAAEAAAMAVAGAGGAAAGASVQKDQVVRGGRPGASVAPGTPHTDGKPAPAKGAQPLGGVPADEARAVRNAEKFGARPKAGGGPGFLQPASTRGEEDGEHVRKYGIDSGDVFEDDRLIAPALLGDDDRDDVRDYDNWDSRRAD